MITRRRALQLALGSVVACRGGRDDVEPTVLRPATAPSAVIDDSALDEVLEALHAREPKSKQGLSTHAPMVAEALCALGYADRAKPWVEQYDAPLIEIPTPGSPIDPARWRDALGPNRNASTWENELARYGDWRVLMETELRDGTWQSVLDRWVARLAPGLSSAATHGVIRTAHAARALSRRDTPPRRAELARGLAYWAAAHEELPRGRSTNVVGLDDALAKVPLYTEKHGATPRGNIVRGLRAVAKLDGFGAVHGLVTLTDVDAAVAEIARTFARVYLQHAGGGHAVAFAHAITGPVALRRIAPHVDANTAAQALPFAWQTAAAVYAAYATRGAKVPVIEVKHSRDELVTRALDRNSDHAIKLTEVLLAEHALRADDALLAAASDATARL